MDRVNLILEAIVQRGMPSFVPISVIVRTLFKKTEGAGSDPTPPPRWLRVNELPLEETIEELPSGTEPSQYKQVGANLENVPMFCFTT